MLSYEEALQRLIESVPPPCRARVRLEESAGLILARPVPADIDLPPFDKSFVDGFALRSRDVSKAPLKLEVVGTVAAGSAVSLDIAPGQAAAIMTGAPLPRGADAVQMVEKTRRQEEHVEILEPVEPGRHVGAAGSEIRRGQTALEQGRWLGPAELAVLATFGCVEVEVFRPPVATIIPTGDELAAVSRQPGPGQIRNSNAVMLAAQCKALRLPVRVLDPVPDDPQATLRALATGLEGDLVIFSGGVSMGERDCVQRVLAEAGVEISFHKAAIKPGKPLLVGRRAQSMVFGLPGNPVSAFVTFELFVRPAVRRWMGVERYSLPRVKGRITADVRQAQGRKFFAPALTRWSGPGFEVRPVPTAGSADLTAFSRANSLMVMEAERDRIEAGEPVQVLLLDQGLEKGAIHEADACG